MKRCQLSIIFLFFSIFAASNGDLIFTFQHEDEVRPHCMDDMKIVYLVNRTHLPFTDRFEAVHTIGATEIAECSEPKVKFISSTAVPAPEEKKFFEDLGAKPSVVAIVLMHKLERYSNMHPSHDPASQHRWAIEISVLEFGPIYDIKRLLEPEWIEAASPLPTQPTTPPVTRTPPPPPAPSAPGNPSTNELPVQTTSPKDSPASMSTSPSDGEKSKPTNSSNELPTAAPLIQDTTSKPEECEGFPLWGYIVIAVLAVLFFVSFVSAIWCCCKNRELRRQLKSMNKAKKLNPESEKTATTTQMQQSAESKSKSVPQKNRSKRSKGNKTSGTKDSE